MDSKREMAVRRHIEHVGGRYNQLTAGSEYQHYLSRRKDMLKGLLKEFSKKDGVAVDLASGPGNYNKEIMHFKLLLNLDLSFNALKNQKEADFKTVRINADALHVPLKDGSADCVFLIGLLHHVPGKVPALLEEASRILKKGGVAIIDEANGYNPAWFVIMKFSEIDRIGTKPILPYSLRRMAGKSGLFPEQERYWGFIPPGLNEGLIKVFTRVERWVERSIFARLSARYTLICRKA